MQDVTVDRGQRMTESLVVIICGWILMSLWRTYQLYRFSLALWDLQEYVHITEKALGLPPLYNVVDKYRDGSISYLYWRMWIDVSGIIDVEKMRAAEYVRSLREAYRVAQATDQLGH